MARDQSPSAKAAAKSLRQWPLLIVVAGVALGLLIVLLGQWSFGCLVIGCSMGVGAVERLALSNREAGLLQVRSKPFDIIVLVGMGAAIIALAIAVPDGR